MLDLHLKLCVSGKGSFISPIAFFNYLRLMTISALCTAALHLVRTVLFFYAICSLFKLSFCTIIIIVIIISITTVNESKTRARPVPNERHLGVVTAECYAAQLQPHTMPVLK